jgi:hypothetical protein
MHWTLEQLRRHCDNADPAVIVQVCDDAIRERDSLRQALRDRHKRIRELRNKLTDPGRSRHIPETPNEIHPYRIPGRLGSTIERRGNDMD